MEKNLTIESLVRRQAQDVTSTTGLTGDANVIHVDDEGAETTTGYLKHHKTKTEDYSEDVPVVKSTPKSPENKRKEGIFESIAFVLVVIGCVVLLVLVAAVVLIVGSVSEWKF